ncbi:MAG: YihY/virulence factor BrkB family protein [Bacteroidota bacterium]
MDKIIKYLLSLPFFSFLVKLSKRIVPPGFEGMPLYNVTEFFYKGFKNGAVNMRASSLAYKFFLALFPGIIFLFTLIAYVPISGFQDQLLQLIKDLLPDNAYKLASSTITDIIKHQHGGLLSVVFIASIYFSINAVNSMITLFNKSHHYVETRKPLQQYVVAIILTFSFAIMVMLSVGLIVFTEFLLHKMAHLGWIKTKGIVFAIKTGRWLIISVLMFLVVSFLYYLGPAKHNNWRFASVGSTLATLLMLLTSIIFTYYVNNFANYNKVYGSIGTLIVILLWIYFNAMILLIGFELNASIDIAKKRSIQT